MSGVIQTINNHPQARQFLQDFSKQAACCRHTLYRSMLTHTTALHHLTDADIALDVLYVLTVSFHQGRKLTQ
jgi:hypothetical protein